MNAARRMPKFVIVFTERLFKIVVVIGLVVLYVSAVIFFAGPSIVAGPDEVCFDELDGECYKIADVIVLPGPRSPVEVLDPLPHRPVQEYEVE
ncbi:hypothetical protein LCGC14_0887320 [marine sediment metagenome]|uniref:Uncharacterized protein n=1 Tax=marine sediment metagenome TaxID=412755 RepID=A0A0F9RJP3_9ZZZZ